LKLLLLPAGGIGSFLRKLRIFFNLGAFLSTDRASL